MAPPDPGTPPLSPEPARPRPSTLESALPKLGVLGVVLVLLALYLSAGAPGPWWGDGLELSAAAFTLGVPHPTGYPLFMLLGHGWIKAASGLIDPGRALTVLCALLSAGSAGTIGWALLARLSRPAAGTEGESRRALPDPWAWLSVLGLTGLIGLSRTVWDHATITEVYPLTLFLAAVIIARATRLDPGGRSPVGAAGQLGGLFGLSLLNHYSILTLAPLAALTLGSWARRSGRSGRLLAVAFLSFLGPLGGYLYLPWRAAANPPINWGDPQSLKQLLWVLRGGDYLGAHGPASGEGLTSAVRGLMGWVGWWGRQWLPVLLDPVAPLAGALALAAVGAGCMRLARREPYLGWGLAASLAASAVIAVAYPIPDIDGYFLASLPVAAVALAELIAPRQGSTPAEGDDGRRSGVRRRAAPACSAGALLLYAAVLGTLNFSATDKSWDDGPQRWASAVLEALPGQALVITRSGADSEIFALWHRQIVAGERPDVTVFGAGFIFSGWYRRYFEREDRPQIPVFVVGRPPGEKAVFDVALAGGVILPNVGRRGVFAVVEDLSPEGIDPIFRDYMDPRPVAELLPAAYYERTAYKLNPPGRWLVELRPEPEFLPRARERFEATFGQPPPAP